MGRRKPSTGSGGGGGGGGAFNRSILIRHIESCDINTPSVDQIVDYLRSTFPHYSRQKLQPLTRQVEKTLQFSNSSNSKRPRTFSYENNEEDEDEEIYPTPNKKEKRKISNSNEERLQLLEAKHLAKMRVENDSLTGTTDEESIGDDDDESSSEDGIYGEELEPKIDLMKDELREKYIGKIGSGVKQNRKEEKWKELEMVNDNARVVSKKIDLVKRSKRKVEVVSKNRKESESNVESRKGPMFKDLGGMKGVIEDLIMEIVIPLYHPQLARHLGVKPMSGILLNGPPGCGKTKLAHAIANETGVPFYSISATELVSGISGASEENIRELFSKAYRTAPSIVFIDEIDAIASKRENMQREMERRIVTQLMTCMDESHKPVQPSDGNALSEDAGSQPGYILVIGATNRPDAVDPALRRPGRFDREITLGVPDETARIDILSKLTDKLKLEGSFDLEKIARSTPGFVGADLVALTFKAGNLALKRLFDQRKSQLHILPVAGEHAEEWWRQPWSPEEIEKLSITMADFEEAVKQVQPSSRREGFSAIPNIKWEDVGGLDTLRLEFDSHIVQSIKNPKLYADFGINTEIGFLLYGPPGCGKTLIAKAVAHEAGANFIHIKGPELLNKYVGESELAVRTIFSRARTCSPCVLFFDEVDALTTQRGREGGQVVERLVTQLLIELDGAEKRKGVFVIGATNRPEIMDPAFLRPGRFGKLLYVPLPSPDERGMILKALARKKPIDGNVNLMAIAKDDACGNLSGADLAALLNDAAMAAVQEEQTSGDGSISSTRTIKDRHFMVALQKIAPSVSDKQRKHYDLLSQRFGLCSVPNKSDVKQTETGYVFLEQSQPKP